MSKQTVSWCCALVVALGFVVCGPLVAQQQGDDPFGAGAVHKTQQPVRQVEVVAQSAEQRINAALDRRLMTSLNYDNEQLDFVLDAIADEYGIPIVFDKAALDEVAISPESEVSISFLNISLRSALNLMFKEPGLEDLCYVVDEEVLLITTEEKSYEKMKVLVYRVDDLLDSNSRRFNAVDQYGNSDHLINVIISGVEYDAWMEHGTGEGVIHFFPPGMLVIRQSQRVHEQVEKLLGTLRSTKQQILIDTQSTASKIKPATQGFAIDVEMGENPDQVQQQLVNAIQKSVDWSTAGKLSEQEAWIDVLPNRVLVRHLPIVLSQVSIVLADMQIAIPDCENSEEGDDIENGRCCGFDESEDSHNEESDPDLAE